MSIDKNESFKLENNVIEANDSEAILKIVTFWEAFEEPVTISSFIPLIDNEDFIKSVIKYGIKFCSIKEPLLSTKVCDSLHYVYQNSFELNKEICEKSDKFKLRIGLLLDNLESEGFISMQAKANELNQRKIRDIQDKKWTNKSITKAIVHYEKLKTELKEKNKNLNNPNQPKP